MDYKIGSPSLGNVRGGLDTIYRRIDVTEWLKTVDAGGGGLLEVYVIAEIS